MQNKNLYHSICYDFQAEQSTRNFLKSTIKYYANNIDKTETITVTWDGIMTQVIKNLYDLLIKKI